jgi:hypothetical protein
MNYEIPEDLLSLDFSRSLDPGIRNALLFERDGKRFVRWIIQPEDTRFHLEVATWLRAKGLPHEPRTHFMGRYTASRSIVVQAPLDQGGTRFSIKTSTNFTAGAYKDKKQTLGDAQALRLFDDVLEPHVKGLEELGVVVFREPGVVGIPQLDQGMVIRSLEPMFRASTGPKKFWIPAFTVTHSELGKLIASRNGSADPAAFWARHYARRAGHGAAAIAHRFGITSQNPHSQNYLIELDQRFAPTGRIGLRDLGDSFLYKPLAEKLPNGAELIAKWYQGYLREDYLHVAFTPFQGSRQPEWIPNPELARRWNLEFLDAFEKTFSELSGVPRKLLASEPVTDSLLPERQGWDVRKFYNRNGVTSSDAQAAWAKFISAPLPWSDRTPSERCSRHVRRGLRQFIYENSP